MWRNFVICGTAYPHSVAMDKLTLFLRNVRKKDLEITERFLGNSPFHSAFWARRQLRSAVKEAAIYGRGSLLDAGCGLRPYEGYFKDRVKSYLGLDYAPDSGYLGNKADIYGNIKNLPFKNNSFDTILCSEVLEHIDATDTAINEFYRVIKNGGNIIVTSPFIYPLHGGGEDFFRFTKKGLIAILERHNFKVLGSKAICGPAKTIAVLFNISFYEELFLYNRFLYFLGILIRPLLWLIVFLINVTAGIFEIVIKADQSIYFNSLIVAEARDKADYA